MKTYTRYFPFSVEFLKDFMKTISSSLMNARPFFKDKLKPIEIEIRVDKTGKLQNDVTNFVYSSPVAVDTENNKIIMTSAGISKLIGMIFKQLANNTFSLMFDLNMISQDMAGEYTLSVKLSDDASEKGQVYNIPVNITFQ